MAVRPRGGASNNELNEREKLDIFFVVEYQDGRR